MPNPFFSFKQFTVYHDRCAMKVGTDGVLLGAWADVTGVRTALDIGTGTGLVALMLAQRSSAQVTAVEIDEAAVAQARENVAASPWSHRIGVEQADICCYSPQICFDLIVSNPPYFDDSLKCPGSQRSLARHTEGLDFERLMQAVARLLQPKGLACVVIPAEGREKMLRAAETEGLMLVRQTWVHTKPDASPKRVLLAFRFANCGMGEPLPEDVAADGISCEALLGVRTERNDECITDHLTIELARHVYSDEYIALTKDFYLKM